MRRPNSIVERSQDAHEDANEALNEPRARSSWPRENVHVGWRLRHSTEEGDTEKTIFN